MDRDVSLYQQVSAQFQPLGRIEALLLTTFGLDVSYLEKSILPAFFPSLGEGPATEPHRPLFEYLEETPVPISVMYDANQLIQREAASVIKELRWQAHAVMKRSGCFHPKVIVALTQKDEQQHLVIGCSSANLTRLGWGLNYEACAFEVITLKAGMKNSLLIDVMELLQYLQQLIGSGSSEAMRRLLQTLEDIGPRPSTRAYRNVYRTRLWFGQDEPNLKTWLQKQVLGSNLSNKHEDWRWRMEVISPYYSIKVPELVTWASKNFSARGVEIEGASILYFCPRNEGMVDVDAETVAAFAAVEHGAWAEFPTERLRSQLRDSEGNRNQRFMHAKVYRFWTPRCEVLVVGSANATTQGHRDGPNGNEEACLVLCRTVSEGGRPFKPWLRPLERDVDASQCRQAAKQNEDASPEHPVPDLRVCFDWQSKELSVANQDSRALSIYLGADRVPLLSIQYKDESSLILNASQTQSLFANPAVRVGLYGSGDKMWVCLVEEQNLHQKPAAPAMERSIDDLLRDWQLGSEQRQAEYIARAAMPDDMRDASTGFSPELDNGVETDRLNDFFMAMHRFRTDILAQPQRTGSLDAFVKMQIQARLFGRGVMSVRYLLEKLRSFQNSEESRQDVVDRYLGLMALRDALQRLQGEVSATGLELATEMNVLLEEVNSAIADARLHLIPVLEQDESSPDARQLISWVEDHFSYDLNMESSR